MLNENKNLFELTHGGILRKQQSITNLFPDFGDKVKGVADKGGLRLTKLEPQVWKFQVHSGTKDNVWYDGWMRFKNTEEMLRKHVPNAQLWTKSKQHVNLLKLAKEVMYDTDIQLYCSCLTGDTRIPLLDGRILTLKEIHKEFGESKKFWVYSADKNGDFVPGEAKSLGITKYVNNFVEVALDNGEVIKCTPDHPFMMRDGSYKKAGELKSQDSLMPLYTKQTKPTAAYSQSYTKVFLNHKKGSDGRRLWKPVHSIVAKLLLSKQRTTKQKLVDQTIEKYLVVHHRDCNSHNNTPENLQWLGKDEHWFAHASFCKDNVITAVKRCWADPEFRAKGVERNRQAGRIFSKKHPELVKYFNSCGVTYMRSEEGRKQASDRMKTLWKEKPNIMVASRTYTKHTSETKNKMSAAWTPERRKKASERMKKLNTVLERNEAGYNNHKVEAIKQVHSDTAIPVYDLRVDEYENFAVGAGVYVHNCPAFKYWGSDYILSLSKYDAKLGPPETRAPNKRNPKQYGSMCKHLQNVMNVLPWYNTTMATWLRDEHTPYIQQLEDSLKQVQQGISKAADQLGQMQAAEPREEPREEQPENPEEDRRR